MPVTSGQLEFPSIHKAGPTEEGGLTARIGFNYQDELAVSLLLEMLDSKSTECIHSSTYGDAIVAHKNGRLKLVRVKSNEFAAEWTIAGLTARKKAKVGTSIFERSSLRDSSARKLSFEFLHCATRQVKSLSSNFPSESLAKSRNTKTCSRSILKAEDHGLSTGNV